MSLYVCRFFAVIIDIYLFFSLFCIVILLVAIVLILIILTSWLCIVCTILRWWWTINELNICNEKSSKASKSSITYIGTHGAVG